MNVELTEKIAKTRLMKEYEKRPDDIANFLVSRGANKRDLKSQLYTDKMLGKIHSDLDELLGVKKAPQERIAVGSKFSLRQAVNDASRHGRTLDDIKRSNEDSVRKNRFGRMIEQGKARVNDMLKETYENHELINQLNSTNNSTNPTPKLSQLGGWVKNNPGKSTAIAAAPVALATTAVLANKAYQKRKALNQSEEANKTASFDYEEMVKMAYEDIVSGFEKEAGISASDIGAAIGRGALSAGMSGLSGYAGARGGLAIGNLAARKLWNSPALDNDDAHRMALMGAIASGTGAGIGEAINTIRKRKRQREKSEENK